MRIELTEYEKKNYPLPEKKDIIILTKIKELEKNKLERKDKEIVRLIRTQLLKDWRVPLINYLNRLLKKYKK